MKFLAKILNVSGSVITMTNKELVLHFFKKKKVTIFNICEFSACMGVPLVDVYEALIPKHPELMESYLNVCKQYELKPKDL